VLARMPGPQLIAKHGRPRFSQPGEGNRLGSRIELTGEGTARPPLFAGAGARNRFQWHGETFDFAAGRAMAGFRPRPAATAFRNRFQRYALQFSPGSHPEMEVPIGARRI